MRSVIAGFVVGDALRTSPAGTWHHATRLDGAAAGALLVDEHVALDRLVAITSRLRTLGLPGVLRVADLVEHGGRVWLLVEDPPEPTLADLLGGPVLDAGSASTVLNEVGETLLALHRAGLTHGAVAAGSVVIREDGTALLTDWNANGNGLTSASDVTGWMDLSRQLAAAWTTSPGTEGFLRRVTELARLSGDLAATLRALRSGADNVLPDGFRERRTLRAAVTATTARASTDRTVPLGCADVTVAFPSGRGVDDGDTLMVERARAPFPSTADDETIGAVSSSSEPDASVAGTQLGERRIQRAGASAEAPAAIRRFGPGVPGALPTVEQSWRAGVVTQQRPRQRSRTRRRLLVLLLASAAAVAALWWVQRPPLEVINAAVRVDPRELGCGATAHVRGVIATNGEPGTITYRWIRSDIGPMAALEQPVPAGGREESVTLQWTFEGEATTEASASLEILAPRPLLAEARFAYRCPS